MGKLVGGSDVGGIECFFPLGDSLAIPLQFLSRLF